VNAFFFLPRPRRALPACDGKFGSPPGLRDGLRVLGTDFDALGPGLVAAIDELVVKAKSLQFGNTVFGFPEGLRLGVVRNGSPFGVEFLYRSMQTLRGSMPTWTRFR
jgi:hypothetical protein